MFEGLYNVHGNPGGVAACECLEGAVLLVTKLVSAC